MRSDIKELIQTNKICVLATVSDNVPHCSLMSYAVDEHCREIYMATLRNTKKYRNLSTNPSVSLLIDSRETSGKDRKLPTKALTIAGTFQSGMGEQRRTALREALLERHPELEEFFRNPAAEIIVVKVKAVQLLDGIADAYFEEIS